MKTHELLQELEDFRKGMSGSNVFDTNTLIKIILKAIELKENGLVSTDIGIKKVRRDY